MTQPLPSEGSTGRAVPLVPILMGSCPWQLILPELPVTQVAFDEAAHCDEEQDKHVESCEGFVDHGGLFHSKGKKPWGQKEQKWPSPLDDTRHRVNITETGGKGRTVVASGGSADFPRCPILCSGKWQILRGVTTILKSPWWGEELIVHEGGLHGGRHPTCQQDHQASGKHIRVLRQPHRAHGRVSTQKPPHLLAEELVKGSTPGPGDAGSTWGEVVAGAALVALWGLGVTPKQSKERSKGPEYR